MYVVLSVLNTWTWLLMLLLRRMAADGTDKGTLFLCDFSRLYRDVAIESYVIFEVLVDILGSYVHCR